MKTHHLNYEKGTRVLEQMTKPSFLVLSLVFCGMGCVGLLLGILAWVHGEKELAAVPIPFLGIISSLALISMFMPFYLCAWSSRILIHRIHDLEKEI
jgi:hypothetical protein